MRKLMTIAALLVSAITLTSSPADVAAAPPDVAHPYSDPVWLPLRSPARVSCAMSNCDGPYHGYPAIDFLGKEGDPVFAAGAGILHIGEVVDPDFCPRDSSGSGTWVWIDHGAAGSTRYYHLGSVTAHDGQLVTPATQIGTMGHSGDRWPCETDYLHFEMRGSESTNDRLPLTSLLACGGTSVVSLPANMGFDTWDDVPPNTHHTPATTDDCQPSSWSSTPARPTAPSVTAAVGAATVDVTPSAADVDSVRVRLELFHPSLNAYGAATEQSAVPTTSAVRFSELLPNRTYRAMVAKHNASGWSDWSASTLVQTGYIPTVPQFRNEDSTFTTIGYRWYQGTNHGAEHTVAIRRAVGAVWGSWEYHGVDQGDLHYRFEGLEPGTSYQVTVRAHNSFATSDWAPRRTITTRCTSSCAAAPEVFTTTAPARFADSRPLSTFDETHRATGPRPGGSHWEIKVGGRGAVPEAASAAIVNVTIANAMGPGFATVYPCGTRPTASAINYRAGVIAPNELVAKLSPAGTICVYTQTTADVIVDVVGYAVDSPYRPLAPERFADSRDQPTFDGAFSATGLRRGGSFWSIEVAGRGQVPGDAEAIVANVTVTEPAGPGYATVYPCGERPLASSINFESGTTRPNELITKLSSDGNICVYVSSDAHVIVDVVGYLGDVVGYTPIVPARLADSRPEPTIDGMARDTGVRRAGTTWRVPVRDRGGVGAASAVVANVTTTGASAPGFLTIFDCKERPNASTLNYDVGTTRANETIVQLSEGGDLCAFTQSTVHIVIDAVGFVD